MRRSDHPSRPSAITCCRFSALKTLAIPAAGVQPTAQVNVSAPGAALAGFQVSINGRFWVSTEGVVANQLGAERVRRRVVLEFEPVAVHVEGYGDGGVAHLLLEPLHAATS